MKLHFKFLLLLLVSKGLVVGASLRRTIGDEAARPGSAPLAEVPVSVTALADSDATREVAALEGALRSKDPATRAARARQTVTGDHRLLADRLLSHLRVERDPSVRLAVIDALGSQRRSETDVSARLEEVLGAIVLARVEQRRRAVPPVPMTAGGVALESEAASTATAVRRAQGREAATLVRALRRLGIVPKGRGQALADLLLDGDDVLVVELLAAWTTWKPEDVLSDLHEVFSLYPTEDRWEGAASRAAADRDPAALAAWLARHGDPLGWRPRPTVVRAIQAYLVAATGRAYATPAALKAWSDDARAAREAKVLAESQAAAAVEEAARREKVAAAFVDLGSGDVDRIFQAATVLGKSGDLSAVEPLLRVLAAHKDPYARVACASALGSLRACDAVAPLIQSFVDKNVSVVLSCGVAFSKISGFDTGLGGAPTLKSKKDAQARCVKWWAEHETEVRSKLGQPKPEPAPADRAK